MMPHKLIDTPPYADINLTSHGFEAIRPEPHKKVRMADYDIAMKKCTRKTLMPKLKSLSNMSIKKFELSKWMSMNGG